MHQVHYFVDKAYRFVLIICHDKKQREILGMECKTCALDFEIKDPHNIFDSKRLTCYSCQDMWMNQFIYGYTEEAPPPSAYENGYHKKWRERNPFKDSIHRIVARNLSKVKVLYECPCKSDNKHNHHFDYTRPFEVIRLCPGCHRIEHKRLTYTGRNIKQVKD